MRYEFLNTGICNFASARLFVGVFGEEGCLNVSVSSLSTWEESLSARSAPGTIPT